jgi:hypothetical protein
MQMSAELFQSIVQSIRSDDQPMDEKRAVPRTGFAGKAQFIPPGDTRRVHAAVRDLSVQGIGLLHTQPMKCGQEFILALSDPTSDGQRGVVCTVARWQPISDKLFLIGARFTRTVSQLAEAKTDDLQQLQSRLKAAGMY